MVRSRSRIDHIVAERLSCLVTVFCFTGRGGVSVIDGERHLIRKSSGCSDPPLVTHALLTGVWEQLHVIEL
jgi:hypothetical protein